MIWFWLLLWAVWGVGVLHAVLFDPEVYRDLH